MMRFIRRCVCALTLFLILAHAYAAPLRVVASFSILADMLHNVGGDEIEVHSLVGRDADAHAYQPSPSDSRQLAKADLVLINGLAFEGWIERLIKSSGYRGKVIVASKGITPMQSKEAHEGHQHHALDPHAWQDLRQSLHYVDNIVQALSAERPESAALFQHRGEVYKQKISALDAEIRVKFKRLPKARRKAISSHDAFAYFSHAYGITFIAPVGIANSAEPSAKNIAHLLQQIRQEHIPAVFLENMSNPRLIEQLRQESGVRLGGTLYADALSPADGVAPTYLEMMRYNAETVFKALAE